MSVKYLNPIVTNHALERWNQRIGPNASVEDIEKVFTYAYLSDNMTIRTSTRTFKLFGDIVGFYKIKNNRLCIITFFGRISLVPAVQYKYEYPHANANRFYLDVNQESVSKMKFNIRTPEHTIDLNLNNEYRLEVDIYLHHNSVIVSIYHKGEFLFRSGATSIKSTNNTKYSALIHKALVSSGINHIELEEVRYGYSKQMSKLKRLELVN